MNCQICTLMFTPKIRVKTVCNKCKFECCKKCLLTYLKSSNKTISCMNCKQETDELELSKFMSKTSISNLHNTVLKEYVYEEEKKLLLFTEKQMIISRKKNELTDIMNSLVEELGESVKEIYVEKINNISLDNFNICIGSCKKYIYRDSDENFYNCKDCELSWCYKCEMECDPNIHTCDIKILNSIKSIEKETKPCPTCGIKIYKIDGCSQIMCSECNTFFDFNTGLKEKEEETKHARNYIEIIDKFEIEIVGIELYNDFHKNIKVCSNYDLWDSPVYYDLIKQCSFERSLVAILINSKQFIRNNLISKLNEKKYNETNRKDFINGIISEKEFKSLSLKSYKLYKNRLYVIKILTLLEFNIETIIHKYVREFNTLREKCKIKVHSSQIIEILTKLELDVAKFISDNKDKIESGKYIKHNKSEYICNIFMYSPDRSISIGLRDLCSTDRMKKIIF